MFERTELKLQSSAEFRCEVTFCWTEKSSLQIGNTGVRLFLDLKYLNFDKLRMHTQFKMFVRSSDLKLYLYFISIVYHALYS